MSELFENLPYILPKNAQESSVRLATILDIKAAYVANADQALVEMLAGTILYRHLDRLQKMDIMDKIQKSGRYPLAGILTSRVVDVELVNSRWGVWSLSNDELIESVEFAEMLDRWSGLIGWGANISSISSFAKKVYSNSPETPRQAALFRLHAMVTLIIWGSILYNKNEIKRLNDELKNRSTLHTSPVY